ncbi:hypothetical protein JL721_10484 [Aureococcus anophagefferens]|nr:hypothetical protein JL721_10484 [Aureococcus anophagefferens]
MGQSASSDTSTPPPPAATKPAPRACAKPADPARIAALLIEFLPAPREDDDDDDDAETEDYASDDDDSLDDIVERVDDRSAKRQKRPATRSRGPRRAQAGRLGAAFLCDRDDGEPVHHDCYPWYHLDCPHNVAAAEDLAAGLIATCVAVASATAPRLGTFEHAPPRRRFVTWLEQLPTVTHSIVAMPPYGDKSVEELRHEDYLIQRRADLARRARTDPTDPTVATRLGAVELELTKATQAMTARMPPPWAPLPEDRAYGLGAGDRVDGVLAPLVRFLDVGLSLREDVPGAWPAHTFAAAALALVERAYACEAAKDVIQEEDVIWDAARLLGDDGVPDDACPARASARAYARDALRLHAEAGRGFAMHATLALRQAAPPTPTAAATGRDRERDGAITAAIMRASLDVPGSLGLIDAYDDAYGGGGDWAARAARCATELTEALQAADADPTELLRCGAFEALARVACHAATPTVVVAEAGACLACFVAESREDAARTWARAKGWRFLVRAVRRVRRATEAKRWGDAVAPEDDDRLKLFAILSVVAACAAARPPEADADDGDDGARDACARERCVDEHEYADVCAALLEATRPGGACAEGPPLSAALAVVLECSLVAPGRPSSRSTPEKGPALAALLGNGFLRAAADAFDPACAAREPVCQAAPSIREGTALVDDGLEWLALAGCEVAALFSALRWQAPGAPFAGLLLTALCEHDAPDDDYTFEGDDVPPSFAVSRALFAKEFERARDECACSGPRPNPNHILRTVARTRGPIDALRDVERKGGFVAARILQRKLTGHNPTVDKEELREREAQAESAEAELLALLDDEEGARARTAAAKKKKKKKKGRRRIRPRSGGWRERTPPGRRPAPPPEGDDEAARPAAAAPPPPPTTVSGVLARVGLGHLEAVFEAEEVDFEALGLLRPDDFASLGIAPADANAIVSALAAPVEARFAPARRGRLSGTVLWFNKSHGFVQPDGGGADVFVHLSDVCGVLKAGDRVLYDVTRFKGRDNFELMEDPVIAADGHTYERRAIAAWFERRRTSPITNEALPNLDLVPAHAIRSMIARYRATAS